MSDEAFATGFMTNNDDVGLASVQLGQRHAGICRVQKRSLPLDNVPVVFRRVRTQYFRRTGGEIGDNRIDRYSAPGNENSGLAGSAEIGGHTAPNECASKHSAVYFLPRAQSVPIVSKRLPLRSVRLQSECPSVAVEHRSTFG